MEWKHATADHRSSSLLWQKTCGTVCLSSGTQLVFRLFFGMYSLRRLQRPAIFSHNPFRCGAAAFSRQQAATRSNVAGRAEPAKKSSAREKSVNQKTGQPEQRVSCVDFCFAAVSVEQKSVCNLNNRHWQKDSFQRSQKNRGHLHRGQRQQNRGCGRQKGARSLFHFIIDCNRSCLCGKDTDKRHQDRIIGRRDKSSLLTR